jgi:hypothetical protein
MKNHGVVPTILEIASIGIYYEEPRSGSINTRNGYKSKFKTLEGFHQNAPNKKGAFKKAPLTKYSRWYIILLI